MCIILGFSSTLICLMLFCYWSLIELKLILKPVDNHSSSAAAIAVFHFLIVQKRLSILYINSANLILYSNVFCSLRAVCGMRGRTLIVNLPGSKKGSQVRGFLRAKVLQNVSPQEQTIELTGIWVSYNGKFHQGVPLVICMQ